MSMMARARGRDPRRCAGDRGGTERGHAKARQQVGDAPHRARAVQHVVAHDAVDVHVDESWRDGQPRQVHVGVLRTNGTKTGGDLGNSIAFDDQRVAGQDAVWKQDVGAGEQE